VDFLSSLSSPSPINQLYHWTSLLLISTILPVAWSKPQSHVSSFFSTASYSVNLDQILLTSFHVILGINALPFHGHLISAVIHLIAHSQILFWKFLWNPWCMIYRIILLLKF
jgi:hypothetical protein